MLNQPNGDVILATPSGTVLPIHGNAAPLSASDVTVQPGAYYPAGGIPPIMLNGTDVTSALSGGQIGANIALRDDALPTDQAELDEFSQNLASAFSGQGLPLFTNAAGTVPSSSGSPVQSGYVGFAATIQVNPAVSANAAAVRDGIPSTNTAGLAGYSSVIGNVLNNVLGTAPLATTNTSGLGADGSLSAPYSAPATLADFASTLVATQSTASAQASGQLTTEQAMQNTLQTKLSSATGVSMDTEMSDMISLQNAYGANAKIIGAVQTMYTTLLGMVAE